MIHEVDEVLKGLIGGGALAGSGIDVSFEAPTRDWAARRNGPAVNTYLYDIREDVSRRQRGHMPVRDERDIVVRRRQPPRWFRLSYLVTAWTKQPQDEHRLLSAVLANLLRRELLPPDELPGSLGALGLTLPLSVAGLHTESRSLAEIWSALGGELKPSLDLVVTVPFPAFPEYDAGPPVTEGAAIRVRGIDGSIEGSEQRAHRPGQLASAPVTGGGATVTVRTAPDTDALLPRLARLRERVAELVAERGATDPTAGDPLRGLYLSEEGVRHLLEPSAGPYPSPVFPDAESAPYGPLELLAGRLGLTELDTRILLIALAPDLDRSYEQLYGYLNDDVSRRRATVGLALDLCGLPVHLARVRARFAPSAPLSALGLLTVEDPERPFLGRALRVPDRLIAHLLGDDSLDSGLMGRVRPLGSPPSPDARSASDARPGSSAVSPEDGGFTARLAARLAAAPVTVHLREYREGDGLVRAAAALRTAGIEALHFTPPAAEEDLSALLPRLLREARLRDCAVVVSPLPEKPGPLVRALTAADVSVLFVGPQPYDPQWSDRDPLVLDVPRPPAGAVDAWAAALGAGADGPGFDLAATVAPYRLGGDRIERAARAAVDLAAFDGTEVTAAHLRLAARLQSASGLERHARRIRPDVGWDDLVLPDKPLAELRELALRARHRDRVLGDWRLSAGGGRGRGVLGLFAGESGTGKTLSAEVVAAELGLDLYVVQLSSIVDKYVGETEKNLERIFTEADRTDAVLLFDEADAVFGKRSEVKDSHDKYANMESAYLLQRLESFDGIALLTTNLRANIDEAFTRRLDLVVDFPFPDTAQRLALWRHSLAAVPRADDIDAAAVARDFELAGGSIRSAVVTAAYAAAGRGGPVTTADLREGAEREYRKAGRLVPGEGNW